MEEDTRIIVRDHLLKSHQDLLYHIVDIEGRGDDGCRLPQILCFLPPFLFEFKQTIVFDGRCSMCSKHFQ